VTHIGNAAFKDCTGLTSVTVPAGVAEIGGFAFYGLTNLLSITCLGGYPAEGVGSDLYNAHPPCAITSYVYRAHAASWDPQVKNGPIEAGRAKWQGRPIRLLRSGRGRAPPRRGVDTGRK
jgi:hypothetical protein